MLDSLAFQSAALSGVAISMLCLCFLSRHLEEGVLDDSPRTASVAWHVTLPTQACPREPRCQGQVWAGTSTATRAPRRGAALARNRHPPRNLPAPRKLLFRCAQRCPGGQRLPCFAPLFSAHASEIPHVRFVSGLEEAFFQVLLRLDRRKGDL